MFNLKDLLSESNNSVHIEFTNHFYYRFATRTLPHSFHKVDFSEEEFKFVKRFYEYINNKYYITKNPIKFAIKVLPKVVTNEPAFEIGQEPKFPGSELIRKYVFANAKNPNFEKNKLRLKDELFYKETLKKLKDGQIVENYLIESSDEDDSLFENILAVTYGINIMNDVKKDSKICLDATKVREILHSKGIHADNGSSLNVSIVEEETKIKDKLYRAIKNPNSLKIMEFYDESGNKIILKNEQIFEVEVITDNQRSYISTFNKEENKAIVKTFIYTNLETRKGKSSAFNKGKKVLIIERLLDKKTSEML